MAFVDTTTVANGQAAAGAANAGYPIKIGAVYNASAPTITTGDIYDAQLDVNGNLKTVVENGVASGTAGSASANVLSVQGIASMTPVQVATALTTAGGASYSNIIAPATPAVTTAKASAGNVYGFVGFNSNATPVFLKVWDAASVTLGTTAATYQFMIPGNTGGAGFVCQLPIPRSHANTIKYAVTGAIATNDNTVVTANTVIVDVSYN